MNKEDLLLLLDYNYWANGRILSAAQELSAEQYTAAIPGVSHGSVRATLSHMLAAENIWRLRCLEGESPSALLSGADFPSLDSLRARWQEEERLMRDGLARLPDGRLAEVLDYRTTSGRPMSNVRWQLLVHLVNHGTQHRAEAAVALTAFGYSPGDVDLIIYLRQT